MADGQEPQGTPTPSDANKAAAGAGKDGAASEAFRLDSGNAPGRDDAAERARDYGSLDILQGESDPANPNLHTGTRQPVDPGTYQQNLGAPADSGAVDGTTPGAGLSGIAASSNGAEQSFVPSASDAPASVNATPGASASLNDTTLDATLDTGISTLQALTDRIARLAAGDDDTTNTPAPATAQYATAQRTGTNPSLTPEPTEETINRPPTDILLDNAGVVENAAPGTVVAVLSAIDPDSGEVFTYEIAGGSDLFEIVGNAVLVKEGADLDHETLASVDLQLVVRDSAGNTYFETVTLEIRDVNEVATDITLDGSTIAENASGATVGTLSTTDQDNGDTHTYAVSDDRFEVVDGQLKLKDGVALDHEAEDTVSIDVTTTDAGGLDYTETFTVTVADINEAPIDIELTGDTVVSTQNAAVTNENISTGNGGGAGTSVVTLPSDTGAAITVDFARIDNSFELVVNGQSLTGNTIQLQSNVYDPGTQSFLQFADGTPISRPWVPTEDGGPRIQAVISENGVEFFATRSPSSSVLEPLELVNGSITAPDLIEGANTVTIINPDDHGPDGIEAVLSASFQDSALGVDENEAGAVVGTLQTTDPDEGDTHTYAVSDDRFEVVDGQLKLKDGVALDHEAEPSLAIDVTTTDAGGLSRTETFNIAVGDINEVVTDIALDNTTIAENAPGAVVGTLSVVDPDEGDTHTYAVSDDRFEVVDGQLKLKDGVALDHEAEEAISVDVTATDAGGLARTETFDIAVSDVNEAPNDITLTPAPHFGDTAELTVRLGGEAFRGDPNYQILVDGQVVGEGTVSWARDTETDGTYTTLGGNGDVDNDQVVWQNVSINVPVPEGGLGLVEVRFPNDAYRAGVGDRNLIVDYIEVDGHRIEAESSDVNYQGAGGSYDSSLGAERMPWGGTLQFDTTSIFEGATFGGDPVAVDQPMVMENAPGAVVGTLTTTDPDAGDTHTYAVSDDRFEVVDGQLKLKDGVALDHETADSISIEVTATDAGGLARTETFDIAVRDVNEAPNDIGMVVNTENLLVNGSFEEGTLATGRWTMGDAETVTPGWQSDGNVELWDNLFGRAAAEGDQYIELDSDRGVNSIFQDISTNPGQVYELDMSVMSRTGRSETVEVFWNGEKVGSFSTDQTSWQDAGLKVVGTGDTDRLEFREPAGDNDSYGGLIDDVSLRAVPFEIGENAAGAVIATLSVVDPDAGDSHTYAVSDDRFEVVSGQLKLKDGISLNHEDAATVSIDVSVTDQGGLSHTENLTLSVLDVNEGPTDIVLDGTPVVENDAGAVVGTISVVDPDAGDTHTYTVSDDRFEVVDGQLKLKDGVALDHETADSISVDVTATDAGGLARTESFDIAVGDANEVATDIGLDGTTVAEND
ncbi:carbohydrate-binding domain-containing protein, partial [Pyruvatibacter sp.]|uniref:carbohydrate-binding domain-containing protein n=1 Tax=Pyruvatibacter sp. TaxID=1981328 RepID=UPI0032EE0B24